MQFLISVIDNQSPSGTADEMDAIIAFNSKMRADGYFVFAGGLGAPTNAAVIDNRGGSNLVSEGPLFNSTEFYSGFWIIDVPNSEIARKLARDGSLACNRKVELRPFLD